MRTIRYSKYGLAENPIGYHVMMPYKGRNLLGEVRDVTRDHTGSITLTITHFNGEDWPMRPLASVVTIIEN